MKQQTRNDDRGAILIIVLVVSIVLSTVVIGVAKYTFTSLKYGQISEQRAHRIASAQAAMDDAIERLELKRSLCSTLTGSTPQVINNQFPPVNGTQAKVTCEVISAQLPPSDGWAIVITGQGAPASGDTLQIEAGGRPTIQGPIYTNDYKRMSFQQPTTLLQGDLWYLDAPCSQATGSGVAFQRSGISINKLVFDPSTRGSYCTNQTWQQLFGAGPPVPANLFTMAAALPPLDDGLLVGTCKVFFPGRYDTAPALAANNYFKSGNYYFNNVGVIDIKGKAATFGNMSTSDDFVYPLIDQNDTDATCKQERLADSTSGATVYLGGSSQISVSANSGFEVSRRLQASGTTRYYVSMQVLDSSTVPFSTPIIASAPGNGKDIALNGLVWAPKNTIDFGTVAATKDAAIRGGAVVAAFTGTISNSGSGFLIKVPTSEASIKLRLESTAVLNGKSTTVSVIADWRPSSGQLAVNSWRVVN